MNETLLKTPWRCLRTGNPVGTDTYQIGRPCACQVCRADVEIAKLKSQLEEARANNKRLREGIEIMANPAHWGAALNLSTSIGVKAWDFARALIAGSTK